MNDVRNLMGHLHTQMDYREFDGGVRPPAGAWPILQQIGRRTPAEPHVAEAGAHSAEPAAARAPLVCGLKRPERSLLTRYAPAEAACEDGRRLPLAEVFARLAGD